ncbi:hypothetical protein P7G58_01100 [Globicatella sulfidifaciens]|uniref:hypothetical protein n=1 Tax=Globicatella sulfidifaciens TaxID=136093 RepID=UPI002890B07E|nr:hypothetical protein [Globicatella sulfidifaciens]MDT2767465.1 hypothetical protein [Globicatella sulfidifaciens]
MIFLNFHFLHTTNCALVGASEAKIIRFSISGPFLLVCEILSTLMKNGYSLSEDFSE